jgi:hypothetical protein
MIMMMIMIMVIIVTWTPIALGKVLRKIWKLQPHSLYYYETKQYKSSLDEKRLKLLKQYKQSKFQWLQNPSQTNEDNPNNVSCETNGIFGKKERRNKE